MPNGLGTTHEARAAPPARRCTQLFDRSGAIAAPQQEIVDLDELWHTPGGGTPHKVAQGGTGDNEKEQVDGDLA
jgi:hypothetical protein